MKVCPVCKNNHDGLYGSGKFCSRKCSNTRTRSEETKLKIRDSINAHYKSGNAVYYNRHTKSLHSVNKILLPKQEICAEYTKVYLCTCKYSGKTWYSKTVKQVHPDLVESKARYTYSCQFRFGISSYPTWFKDAGKLIEQYGWYSTPGSRKGRTNLNGLSRDHLYSITDGWINNVPPALIRHPANCELVPHKENQSKHKKSKITLDELKSRIAQFDTMFGNQ